MDTTANFIMPVSSERASGSSAVRLTESIFGALVNLFENERKERYISTEADLPTLSQIPAAWLADVEELIQRAMKEDNDRLPPNVMAVHPEVARVGLHFFRSTSDLLPDKPYLYGLQTGELVAEHKGGKLSSIIDSTGVQIIAIDGESLVHTRFTFDAEGLQMARASLKRLALDFNAPSHGNLGTQG